MELRHLRYFAAVADTCHFGRAAERLHLAQPALSQAIRQLEGELGTELFTRTTRQVTLTPAGEFLRVEAGRLLGSLDDSITAVQRVAAGRSGLVRVGFTGTAAFTHLPRIARVLRRDLPEVALEVRADLLTPEQSRLLADGGLDLGVLRPPTVAEGLVSRTIVDEALVLALPADHRLADEPVIDLVDLRAESFVGYANADSTVNDVARRACRDAGFTPRQEHAAPSTAVLLALVAAGMGVALVPDSARALRLADVVFREVTDSPHVELALAWREEPSALVRSVLDTLTSAGLLGDAQAPEPVGAIARPPVARTTKATP